MIIQKRHIFGLLFAIVLFGANFFPPQGAHAHDLIPRPLQDYVAAHPNATPEEIKVFADSQDPAFAAKYKNGEEILAIVRNQETSVLDNALDFLKLGIGHILSGPDHILFVLSLLLVFATIGDIFRLTSIFTIAHSITLILSGLGILVISPRVSEPLIALSIAYVAITTVFFKDIKFFHNKYSKPASVFFFGLFHGLGFAGLLREIQIPSDKFLTSLFSFNVGIEIGQLIIICLALPLIYLFRNKKWYPIFIKVFAIIIAALAFVWVIERVFFNG